jgi:hypothetical protein
MGSKAVPRRLPEARGHGPPVQAEAGSERHRTTPQSQVSAAIALSDSFQRVKAMRAPKDSQGSRHGQKIRPTVRHGRPRQAGYVLTYDSGLLSDRQNAKIFFWLLLSPHRAHVGTCRWRLTCLPKRSACPPRRRSVPWPDPKICACRPGRDGAPIALRRKACALRADAPTRRAKCAAAVNLARALPGA